MQLAIITDIHYRAQVVEQSLRTHGWQLLTCVGQAQPYDWVMQHPHVDLVLIDLNVANAVELCQQLTETLPHMPLVALVTPQRIVELQAVMLAGAATFVAFPFEPNQLIAALERAHRDTLRALADSAAQPTGVAPPRYDATGRRQGKVIVVTSLKGGVGRSTIAANLAVLLRQRTRQEIVLVEAHHALGHLALLLNLYPRHTLKNLDGEPNLDLDLLQGLLQRHGSGVRLLAAPSEPTQLVELPVDTWQQLIDLLKTIADYVVIDTAVHADELLSTLLAQADDILLVTGADIAGLRDGRILLQSLRQEALVAGQIHLVLNRTGAKGGSMNALRRSGWGNR
ncbi:MAG: P-loop NTPase [Caldilineaceae bacterium]